MRKTIAATAVLVLLALTGCSANGTDPTATGASSTSTSWAPAPETVNGLTTLASIVTTPDGPRVGLHTKHGDVTFWSGVNLGSTVPGRNPGELAITQDDYRRWLQQMGDLNIRFLRVYTILPPYFYEEFANYNKAHPDDPIYLIHGVYLPDESYIDTHVLFNEKPTEAFTQEINDASAAVSGDLHRDPQLGRASGDWTTDVTQWLAGWIIGAEMDPTALDASDRAYASIIKPYKGKYFATTTTDPKNDPVTPTESWLAERMNELAEAEAARGVSVPIAFVNWPTTDPLSHPTEPLDQEDLVGIDANHIAATPEWSGGTFASYHAYPYYPDFQRYTPEYENTIINGKPDAYAGYLTALKNHHAKAGLPTMVTEFGVPSSIGKAHYGTNGRDQGGHAELEAMTMDASMMRVIKNVGMAGALLFAWSDEWFKATWNTKPRQSIVDDERRALWHDPLTNEQWFGVMATDPVSTGWRTPYESRGAISKVSVDTGPSFLELKTRFVEPPNRKVVYGFDIVPGGSLLPGKSLGVDTSDVAIVYDPDADTLTAYVRTSLDQTRLDKLKPEDIPRVSIAPDWVVQQMTANRSYAAYNGRPAHPAEYVPVGEMIQGDWDPESSEYNSMTTWHVDRDGTELVMRIPWSMLNVADPSSHTAVIPDASTPAKPVAVPFETIGLTINYGPDEVKIADIAWEDWNSVQYTERLKPGTDLLAQAWLDTAG